MPVTVANLLSSLVGRSVLSKQLLEDNKDVWVNFTHFIQVENEISTIDVEDLYDACCRTAAIQCMSGQPEHLGYIVVQAKAKGEPVSSTEANDFVGPYILAKDVDGLAFRYKPKGHVGIMMDLGAKSTFARTLKRIKLTYERLKEVASPALGQAMRRMLKTKWKDIA
ncbi:hypothetical protein A0H81_13307 [Grifola frondosa]|uniref:Uncharacterized protein n=1 Tax=Grifola frondosa TaxID=5627 RepID=A0A1C7LS45_GRIFR|nr:hypothetical protein A0H81_13307 [Grifola frondosa]